MRYLMMAFVLLAGCSSRWTHPDRTDEQFEQDSFECKRIAYATVREGGISGDIQRGDLGRSCLRARGWNEVTP